MNPLTQPLSRLKKNPDFEVKGMRCPICGDGMITINSRLKKEGLVIWRRRMCGSGHRFTTRERIKPEAK